MNKRRTRIAALLLAVFFCCFSGSVFAEEGEVTESQGTTVQTETLTIAHTNDTHGRYQYSEKNGKGNGILGFDRFKTVASEGGADLIVDAGDTFHGLSFATVEKGLSITNVLNAVGYDAMTPGNHDFNYGAAYLRDTIGSNLDAEILSCNVMDNQTGKPYYTDYMVKDVVKDGKTIKVGLFGITSPDLYAGIASDKVEGLTFADPVNGDGSGPVADTVAALKQEGCSVIIALAHMGNSTELTWRSDAIAAKVDGIDLIVDGHTHVKDNQLVTTPNGGQTQIVQTGYYFDNGGMVTLDVDVSDPDGNYKVINLSTDNEKWTNAEKDAAAITPDAAVGAVIKEQEAIVAKTTSEKIGTSPEEVVWDWSNVRLGQTKIGNVVADAYLVATGADLAFENAGGIRGGIPEGDVIMGDLINISPFGNYVVTKELTGEAILKLVEQSLQREVNNQAVYEVDPDGDWPGDSGAVLQWGGLYIIYDLSQPEDSRVVAARVGDKALDAEATYTVAMNQYTAGDTSSYGSELTGSPVLKEYGSCEEILRAYIGNAYTGYLWTDSLAKVYFEPFEPAPSVTVVPTAAPTAVSVKAQNASPSTGVTTPSNGVIYGAGALLLLSVVVIAGRKGIRK